MASLNKVLLIGNLVRDPEMKQTPSGSNVTNFCLAVNNKFKAKDGSMKDDTVFIDVDVWGKQAGPCAEYLSKGSPALIEGRLKMDSWEQDGKKRTRIKCVAQSVQFLSTKGESEQGQAPKQESSPQPSGDASGGPSDGLPF